MALADWGLEVFDLEYHTVIYFTILVTICLLEVYQP